MLKALFQRGIFVLLILVLSVGMVLAQASCPELVQSALLALDENCETSGRNELCYAHAESEASFLNAVSDDFFSEAASLAPVADIETVHTSALNTRNDSWGLALMNLQVNIPNALPEENLVMLLMGEIELENGIFPEETFVPVDGIPVRVTTPAGANIRSGAGTDFNVIGALALDETAIADGISENGEWLRIVHQNRVGWLNISLIDNSNPDLRDLPVLTDSLRTPMQSFYMRSEENQPECAEAPDDILLLQSPRNIQTILTVNGAEIRLGSSGALRILTIDEQDYLEITVFDGIFEIDNQIITAGQRSLLCLGDEQSRGVDGESNDKIVTCEASTPERIDPLEFGEEWCILEELPATILNYPIEILCPGETPATNNTSGTVSEIPGVNCSNFSIQTTYIPATIFTFSWSPAAGADSYDVAIFDSSGYQTAIHTGITGTSISLNGGVGFASEGWIDVRAFLGGVYACYTRLNFTRGADPNENTGGESSTGDVSISATCYYDTSTGDMVTTVTWSGLPSGETINAQLSVALYSPASGSSSQPSGSITLRIYTDIAKPASVNASTTEGSSYNTSC